MNIVKYVLLVALVFGQVLSYVSVSAINVLSFPYTNNSNISRANPVSTVNNSFSLVNVSGGVGNPGNNTRPSFYSLEEVRVNPELRYAPAKIPDILPLQQVSSIASDVMPSTALVNDQKQISGAANLSSSATDSNSNISSSSSQSQNSSSISNSDSVSSSSDLSSSLSSFSSFSNSSSNSSSQVSQALIPSSDFHLNAILSRITPSGGIKSYQTENANKINPYFQNLAVCGIASEISFGNYPNKQALAEAGWRALDWYKNNQDQKTGINYDFAIEGNKETSTNYSDSLDSYVGTYFVALQCMYKATGDLARLKTYEQSMILAYKSLELVYDPIDKLYIARPGWQVKYMMDLVELERGLQEATSVFNLIGNLEYSSKTTNSYKELSEAVQKRFWNEKNQDYYWAIAGLPPQEVIYTSDWSVCYADSKANVWSTTWLTNEQPNRSLSLTNKFDEVSKDTLDTKSTPCKWNPFVQIAMINAGKTEVARSYYQYGSTLAQQNRLGGFYTTGHDGLFLVTKYKLMGKTLVL